jgi:hypothetical protein
LSLNSSFGHDPSLASGWFGCPCATLAPGVMGASGVIVLP